MKRCSQCKLVLPDDLNFCIFCGNKLKETNVVENSPVLKKEAKDPLFLVPHNTKKSEKKRHAKTWILVGTGMLFVFAILIIQFAKDQWILPQSYIPDTETSAVREPFEITSISFHTDQKKSLTGEWMEQRDVAIDKACNIELNQPILNSADNKGYITVTHFDGTKVSIDVQINENTLSIKPAAGYEPGNFYMLKISQEFQSLKGDLLEEPIFLSFVTQANIQSTSLISTTLKPSLEKQTVSAPNGLSIVIPGGLLSKEETVEVNEITGSHGITQSLESEQMKVYEVKIGDIKSFNQPIYLEIPIEPEKLSVSLPIQFAMKANYWDETLYRWVESYAMVDIEKNRLIIPTHHLTKWSVDAIKVDGHIYNDYFSMYYSTEEMQKVENTTVHQFTYKQYIEDVFDSFNDARVKYEAAGFRELEKIQAVKEVYIQEYPQAIEVPVFNIRLTGSVLNDNAYRSKYTGTITLPIDEFTGVNHYQIAHELFHNVQNRYYYGIGMTELGVPLTTSPSSQLLTRQWWLEGTADYAAGRIAYPEGDKPNTSMGGLVQAKHLEKPLTHSPSALAFWRPEDRHSYNNAWLFEFLVQEKKIDFLDLFETVASYYNPSVYSNLVRYLKEKNMDFNEIYIDYALWWFSHPNSPLKHEETRDKAMDKSIIMDYPADYTHNFIFPEWGFDNKHTTKAIKLMGKADDSDPRFIILSYKDSAGWSGALSVKSFLLPENKKQVVSANEIASGSYMVHKLSPKDGLYVLAINNEGHIWTPDIKVHEADLTYSYTPQKDTHQFFVTGTNIPAFLEEGISIVLMLDGKDAAIDKSPDIELMGDKITLRSTFNLTEIEEHSLDIKIVTGKQEIIAEKNIKEKETVLKIDPAKIDNGTLNTAYSFDLEAIHIPQNTQQVKFIWDMGDKQQDSSGSALIDVKKGSAKMSLSHKFSAVETQEEAYQYDIWVKVQDTNTGVILAEAKALVLIPKPVVVIMAPRSVRYEMQKGAKEVEHTFEAYVKNAENENYRFMWDFGDGSSTKEVTGTESTILHTYSKSGSYAPSVTLYSNDGSILSVDTISVILEENASSLENSNKDDPYRKYDEGFVKYDYSQLSYTENEYEVYYYNWKLNEPEGMDMTFYDKAKTKPWSIKYRISSSHMLSKYYSFAGETTFDEEGHVTSRSRYSFDGNYIWDVSIDYFSNGDIDTEVINRDHPNDDNQNLYIQKYYDYTKKANQHYLKLEWSYTNGTFIESREYTEDESDGFVYLHKIETRNSAGTNTITYYRRDGSSF